MENIGNNFNAVKSPAIPMPEFERILNNLDNAITRESELISIISGKVFTLIESQKMAVGSGVEEPALSEDGYVNRVNNRIGLIRKNNERLEMINDVLTNVIG